MKPMLDLGILLKQPRVNLIFGLNQQIHKKNINNWLNSACFARVTFRLYRIQIVVTTGPLLCKWVEKYMKLRTIENLVWVNIPTRKTIIMEINQKSEENQKKFIFKI